MNNVDLLIQNFFFRLNVNKEKKIENIKPIQIKKKILKFIMNKLEI